MLELRRAYLILLSSFGSAIVVDRCARGPSGSLQAAGATRTSVLPGPGGSVYKLGRAAATGEHLG
jgi:hypothetical protein